MGSETGARKTFVGPSNQTSKSPARVRSVVSRNEERTQTHQGRVHLNPLLARPRAPGNDVREPRDAACGTRPPARPWKRSRTWSRR